MGFAVAYNISVKQLLMIYQSQLNGQQRMSAVQVQPAASQWCLITCAVSIQSAASQQCQVKCVVSIQPAVSSQEWQHAECRASHLIN